MDPIPLVRRLASLWNEARSSSPTAHEQAGALADLLNELDATHRELVRRGASMPCAPGNGRHLRRHVEALQSAALEVEVELEQVRAGAVRLRAVAARQLAAARAAQAAMPLLPVARHECFRTSGMLAFMAAAFGAVMGPPLCFLVFGYQGFPLGLSGTAGVLVFLVVRSSISRFEFDGRWVRVTSRLLWMTLESRIVDLTSHEVTLVTTEEDCGDEGLCTFATISLREPLVKDEVIISARKPVDESECLAGVLRGWCAIAQQQG